MSGPRRVPKVGVERESPKILKFELKLAQKDNKKHQFLNFLSYWALEISPSLEFENIRSQISEAWDKVEAQEEVISSYPRAEKFRNLLILTFFPSLRILKMIQKLSIYILTQFPRVMKLEFLDEYEEYWLMQGHYFMSLAKYIKNAKTQNTQNRVIRHLQIKIN